MKHSLTALVVAIGALCEVHPAYAFPVNDSPSNISNSEAALLTTQPAKITGNTDAPLYEIDKLNQISNSIPSARIQEPQPINLLDLFTAPDATLKRLSQEEYNPRPKPIDPIGFFKVPPPNPSLGVTVERF